METQGLLTGAAKAHRDGRDAVLTGTVDAGRMETDSRYAAGVESAEADYMDGAVGGGWADAWVGSA